MNKKPTNYQPNTDREYWEALSNHLHEYDRLSASMDYHVLWNKNRMVAKIDMSNLN